MSSVPESSPIADGCGECDGGQEDVGAAVVSCGDTSEILEASEHALDGVAVPIEGPDPH